MKNKFIINNLQFINVLEGGMTLLEVMVVITIFAVLGILVTESVTLTLQGAKKSESIVKVRENLDYSLSIIERQIRGASTIVSTCYIPPATPVPGGSPEIDYTDQNGTLSSFSCQQMGSDNSYIASGSSRLTDSAVRIVSCAFICTSSSSSNAPVVAIDLTMQDASASGTQKANVSASTQIYLRNY
jgi:prepilin-type N-terminal cleavage/methylation domain-containing protein